MNNLTVERLVLCKRIHSNIKNITVEDFHLINIKRKDAFILFTATWGKHSNRLLNAINKIPKENCTTPFYNIDIDKYEKFANQFGIDGIDTFPTILVYQKGRLKDRINMSNGWNEFMEYIYSLQKGE